MKPPIFPEKFIKNHCEKVLEARDWRKVYKVEGTDEDDMGFAECAFFKAGFGMECESCGLFLTRPFLGHEVDEEFLPQIEKYYEDYEKYAEWKKTQTEAAPAPIPEKTPFQLVCIKIQEELYNKGYIQESEDDREEVWKIIEKHMIR